MLFGLENQNYILILLIMPMFNTSNLIFIIYTLKNTRRLPGGDIVVTPNYLNNGYYNYVSDYDVTYSLQTSELTSGDDYTSVRGYHADYVDIFVPCFLLVVAFTWVCNILSKLWTKGGLLL